MPIKKHEVFLKELIKSAERSTNKMSGFHGSLLVITLIFFSFLIAPSTSTRTEKNPLVELSSREQLVEMAGYGEERLSSVLVTGSVFCEACYDGDQAQFGSLPVSGALVAVHCKMMKRSERKRVKVIMGRAQGKTDEYGDFIVDLPSHLHAFPHLHKACSVRVLRLPKNSPCRRRSTAANLLGKRSNSSGSNTGILLKLSSVGNSIRTYTAGNIRIFQQPYKRCLNKARDHRSSYSQEISTTTTAR